MLRGNPTKDELGEPSMISLRIELLTGRYWASTFNDRNQAEWPPHPARVFSALAATHFERDATASQQSALRWLETLPAPRLRFSAASERTLKVNYVPVNDKALSDVGIGAAWEKVLDPSATAAQHEKAEARLRKAYAKASAPTAKLSATFEKDVAHVLPEGRTKQPRTFPSRTPEEPTVWLSWDATPEPDVREGLDALARDLVRVGHSSSFVAARWTEDAPEPTWVPDPDGDQVIRWVGPGQLAALRALHDAAPYSEQRVMPYVVARYREHLPPPPPRARSSFASNFVVLRRVSGPQIPIVATQAVADGVRSALMSHSSSDPPPPLISGHAPTGGPLQGDHLAIVPLPFVGSHHASGALLGVALIPPAGLDRDGIRPLYEAIARWERATEHRGDGPRSKLNLGSLGAWTLERSLDLTPLHNLRERTWNRPSRQWVSVTPMIFDRHPGPIHDGRADRRAKAIAKAHAIIDAACRRIGLPSPEQIELSVAPFVPGSEPARRFRRKPGSNERRPMAHVALRFPYEVEGPVLLGAGRYRGMGLCRPVWSEADA